MTQMKSPEHPRLSCEYVLLLVYLSLRHSSDHLPPPRPHDAWFIIVIVSIIISQGEKQH